jgi:transcriptional regulator with XRE-family HTH domain
MTTEARPIIQDGRTSKIRDVFWPKVDTRPGHGPNGDCWIWTGYADPSGYGSLAGGALFPGRHSPVKAHQASWVLHNGPIPKGLYVCHKCDNPPCVRPDHLFVGTQKQNIRDAMRKGRMPTKEYKEKTGHWRVTLTPTQGQFVRNARKNAGLNIYVIESLIGIDFTAVHRFELGQRGITIEQLHCLCGVIGLDYDSLNIEQTQMTFWKWALGHPSEKARGGKRPARPTVFSRQPGQPQRPHVFWSRLPEPDLSFYRADLIREALQRKGIPMRKMAEQSGISRPTLMKILNGEDAHSASLRNICIYAGLAAADLFNTKAVAA